MFVKINKPPVSIWNSTNIVKSLLIKTKFINNNRFKKVTRAKFDRKNLVDEKLYSLLIFVHAFY